MRTEPLRPLRDPRTVIYVAAEDAKEALLVCQSPSCRDKRQVRELLTRLHKHKMKKMKAWKLTITAEELD
jgi:hypothetical protein